MAQGLIAVQTLTEDADFRTRVKIATLKAAGNILADPQATEQYKYAGRIVLEPENDYLFASMRYQVALNPVVTEESTDSDIEFTVNSNFEKIALQFAAE